ncbi:MAG: hypothetical protein JNL79_19225 [Myxococcales bacterium]|nr:hypothetical protein [Myxococcales bacterium]
MRQGFLVEPRVFTVPAHALPDLSTVKVRGGDYDERELADAVDRRQLVGNIVEHWRKHADGVRTVVFAVSIAHSKHIVERFQEAGVRAEHLDGGTPMLERDAILARLDRGETQVVGSIGTLCEGTDIPSVKCAILARPTKSTGLYLQQAGRILRPYQDQPAVILDHAGSPETVPRLEPTGERDRIVFGYVKPNAPRRDGLGLPTLLGSEAPVAEA